MRRTLVLLLTVVAVACTSQPPPTAAPGPSAATPPPGSASPTATPAGTPNAQSTPTARPTLPPKTVGNLALDACDPEALVACEQQAVLLAEPIAGSGLSLTYSTEWADGRLDRPAWNASSLGLGGWSLDVLERYDPTNKVVLDGDGSWRFADAVDIGPGEHAIPTYDGFEYFVFDDAWRHVRTVDSITGATLLTFTYDDANRLSNVVGQINDGAVHLDVKRAADGTPEHLAGFGDTETGLSIDSNGNVSLIARPDQTYVYLAPQQFGLLDSVQDPGRGATKYTYDDAGRLATATDADGVEAKLAFEGTADSMKVTTTYATGASATITTEATPDGLKRTFVDTDGTTTMLATDSDGSMTLNEPDGTVTTIGTQAHPRWGMAAPVLTPYTETRSDGTTYSVETTTTMATGAAEPAGGAWETDNVVNGQTYAQKYDPATRTLTQTDPTARTTRTTYTSDGYIASFSEPGAPTISYAYDSMGRPTSVTTGPTDAATTTSYSYDENTGTVTVTLPDGTTHELTYDGFGNQWSSSTSGESVALQRDRSGNLLQVRLGDHSATSEGYSPAGRLTAFIQPAIGTDNAYETRSHTAAGQLDTISGPGERSIKISYDGSGRASGWTFGQGSVVSSYDASTGLLTSNVTSDGTTTGYGYAGDLLSGLSWQGKVAGSVQQTVDGQLKVVSETVNGSSQVDFGRDASGLLTTIGKLSITRDQTTGLALTASDGLVQTSNEYDTNGLLVTAIATSNGTPLLELDYTRDALGRITRAERRAGSTDSITEYTYDAAGRLASAGNSGSPVTYAYDDAGNRTLNATYDDRDRLVTLADATFTYKPDGTLATTSDSSGSKAFTFDDFGALREASVGGTAVSYVVDAGGRRIGRIIGGKLTNGYLYNAQDEIVAMLDGSGAVVERFAYDDDGQLALVYRGASEYVVITDNVGSPVALIDAGSGKVAEQIAYDAWGAILSDSKPGLTPFGFAGGLVDDRTGLVHFGAREYDPGSGRWVEPDPNRYDAGDPNLYRYAFDDPVNLSDPTGLSAITRGGPGGGKSGGGKSGGVGRGRGKGSTKPSPYHDHYPGHQEQQPDKPGKPPAQPPAQPPGKGSPGGATICIVGCYTPGGGVSGSAPGQAGQCFGFCSGGVCIGYCAGTSNNGAFVCFVVCAYGEPHLITADGLSVEFQAAGEFWVARSADNSLGIQARLETAGARTTVTRTTALAMSVAGDRVAFYGDPNRPLIVNGQTITTTDYSTKLAHGGTVDKHGTQATVTWPDGGVAVLHLYTYFMNYTFSPSEAIGPTMVGLAGSHDGNSSNDLKAADGTVVDPSSGDFFDGLYHTFGDSWRIAQADSLFDYLSGESTATFTRPDIPSAPASALDLDPVAKAGAETICQAMGITDQQTLANCVLDVGETGDPNYAAAAGIAAAGSSGTQPRAVTGSTQQLQLDTPTTGDISQLGESDLFTFSAPGAESVYLDGQTDCTVTTIRWQLVDSAGVEVPPPTGLSGGSSTCFDLGRYDLAAGEYAIRVSSTVTTGNYAFEVWKIQTNTFDAALNQPVTGLVEGKGGVDLYSLRLSEPHVVFLDSQGDCAGTDIRWQLDDASGQAITADDGVTTDSALCFNLGTYSLAAGAYTIKVTAGDGTGPYAFEVWDVPPPQTTGIALGQVVSGEIKAAGESDRYTFDLADSQTVYIDAEGNCGNTTIRWHLLDSSGNVVAADDGTKDAALCFNLGAYSLGAGGYSIEAFTTDGLGTYSFVVSSTPPPS